MALTVNGVTNTQTTAASTDVQSAITDGLNRLAAFNTLPDGEGQTINLSQFYGSNVVDAWKKPYGDEIRALANQQPPLTAAQAKDKVNDIMDRFAKKAMFMRLFRRFMFTWMMKIVQKAGKTFKPNVG